MTKAEKNTEKQTQNSNSEKIENSFEYKLAKEQTLVYIWRSVMQEYIYKNQDMQKFYEQTKEIAPARSDFFVNWLKAFVATAELDFNAATEFYKNGFDSISQAEEYTGRFVQQAFTFFMYTENKKQALKVWEYGVSKKMVAPLDENFFKNFNEKEQFWTQFAPKMFKNEKLAEEKAIADYKPNTKDKLLSAIQNPDLKKFKTAAKNEDLNTRLIEGISPLYFAIQTKSTIKGGSSSYAKGMADFRTNQLLSSFDLSHASKERLEEAFLTVSHSMKQTYIESGLGKIMFYAYYCRDEEIESKLNELNKIIDFIIGSIKNPDEFKINSGAKMSNTALYLAAETDDAETAKKLIQKGAATNKANGRADFSFTKKDGTKVQTSIPNTFIYRLISFHSWNTLEMFLTDFPEIAKPQMTEKTETSNVTPLVFLILTLVYGSKNEKVFEQNKKITDSLLPLFQKCGAKLEQNTAFGTAKELLGL